MIDSDTTGPTLLDAIETWGGWMLFDDVRKWVCKRKSHVRHGIERFVADYGSKVRLAWQHRFMDCYEAVE